MEKLADAGANLGTGGTDYVAHVAGGLVKGLAKTVTGAAQLADPDTRAEVGAGLKAAASNPVAAARFLAGRMVDSWQQDKSEAIGEALSYVAPAAALRAVGMLDRFAGLAGGLGKGADALKAATAAEDVVKGAAKTTAYATAKEAAAEGGFDIMPASGSVAAPTAATSGLDIMPASGSVATPTAAASGLDIMPSAAASSAPAAVTTSANTSAAAQGGSAFAKELVDALPGYGVKNPENVMVNVGGAQKSLADAIRAGDKLDFEMLQSAGLDRWAAQNIPAAIRYQSTDMLGLESL